MSKRTIVLVVLLAAGLTLVYRAGAPPASDEPAPAEQGAKAALVTLAGRMGHGVGMIGSKVVAPAVNRMVRDNENHLQLLRHELRSARLTQTAMTNARNGVKQVATLDSAALAQLREGRPFASFRSAMQASGLVTAVRENVRQESL